MPVMLGAWALRTNDVRQHRSGICVSGTATAQEFCEIKEYVREWYGHRQEFFEMKEYVREWYGHHTRVL